MKAILLIGAPGSGKGTAAERLRVQTPYRHVSTGDMLRANVKQGTALGREAEGYMKRGELVPDQLILSMVEELLDQGGADACYMFDGFPRTMPQAEMLDAILAKRKGRIDHVFFLDAPREVLVSRMAGRRVCRGCGTVFHVVNIPPRKAGVCDACGGELYQRADDKEETVLNRLDVYDRQTESLIAYYRGKNLLRTVDSARGVDVLVGAIRAILGIAA